MVNGAQVSSIGTFEFGSAFVLRHARDALLLYCSKTYVVSDFVVLRWNRNECCVVAEIPDQTDVTVKNRLPISC